MNRVLLVSNRLPVAVQSDHVVTSGGGLATALQSLHRRENFLWIGWPGELSRLSPEQRRDVDQQFTAGRLVPVELTPAELHRYYDGFANGVVWPLFHYLLDKVNLDAQADWETYRDVNERFAATVVANHRFGDVVWVHDYQLMLVPALVRQRLPDAKIGFFLHTPFPASEVFRILPWRRAILEGLLGADLIGFHTASYRYNFVYSAARILGTDPDVDAIVHEGRRVELGVHPVGVDVKQFDNLAAEPSVRAEAQRIRDEAKGRKILLGIDRLDYTKGIPRRLLAIERFLEREVSMRDKARFIQIAIPTRERIGAYADFRRRVDGMVGRINGQFGTIDALPIHYLYRSLPPEQLVALYLAADAMLVTPLRDGMNLVAKEYVATRREGTGVLVLSEFAGAAAELTEALHVNPYDIDSVATAIRQAIIMPEPEQRLRMDVLRTRIARQDSYHWAETFLAHLHRAVVAAPRSQSIPAAGPPSQDVIADAKHATSLCIIVDYDGTLVPIAPTPELAVPDDDLSVLLTALAEKAYAEVHLVSGRTRENLEQWFGALPLTLHAEHGFWSRAPASTWVPLQPAITEWKGRLRATLRNFVDRTPASFVEEKAISMAWHYRASDPELASERLRELRGGLTELVEAYDLEVVPGSKVLEVRPRGVHKGRIIAAIFADIPMNGVVVGIGDDRTDEDLFAALPPTAVTIHVGSGTSRAAYRLPDTAAVRGFLSALLP